jgi:hypothetical protein
MFDLLFIVSIIGTCVQWIKEVAEPTIPAENWANKELYHQDIMDGVPIEQCLKNVKNGKYKLTEIPPRKRTNDELRIRSKYIKEW